MEQLEPEKARGCRLAAYGERRACSNLQGEEAWVEELVGLQAGNLQGEEAWVDEVVGL